MKAWKVFDKFSDYSTIVFALTASKAKALALNTDTCEDSNFIDIRARRIPKADKLYHGNYEIDWDNDTERLFLVKELGWSCYDTSFECDTCCAKEYCQYFDDKENEEEDR